MIGPDYIKIMRILTEMESEYIKKVKTTNSSTRKYYLNGVHTLRDAKRKIREECEEENQKKPDPAKKWYHLWRDNF